MFLITKWDCTSFFVTLKFGSIYWSFKSRETVEINLSYIIMGLQKFIFSYFLSRQCSIFCTCSPCCRGSCRRRSCSRRSCCCTGCCSTCGCLKVKWPPQKLKSPLSAITICLEWVNFWIQITIFGVIQCGAHNLSHLTKFIYGTTSIRPRRTSNI